MGDVPHAASGKGARRKPQAGTRPAPSCEGEASCCFGFFLLTVSSRCGNTLARFGMGRKKKNRNFDFSTRLRLLMKRRGLTQKQVAATLKTSQSTVASWLAGSMPGADFMWNLEGLVGPWVNPKVDLPDWIVKAETQLDPFNFESPTKTGDSNLDDVGKFGNISDVKSWPELRSQMVKATELRGQKSALAEFLGVPLASVSRWLGTEQEPGADIALKMLYWVKHPQRQK